MCGPECFNEDMMMEEVKNWTDEGQCTHCGSRDWEPIHPFDYIKKCKKCKQQFSNNPHN